MHMPNFSTRRILCIYRGIESHFSPVSACAMKSCYSSGPVRYIPGRFTQSLETPSMQSSTKKEDGLVFKEPEPGNRASALSNLDGISLQHSRFSDEILNSKRLFELSNGCVGIEESNKLVQETSNSDYENIKGINTISKVDGLRKAGNEIEMVNVGLLAARGKGHSSFSSVKDVPGNSNQANKTPSLQGLIQKKENLVHDVLPGNYVSELSNLDGRSDQHSCSMDEMLNPNNISEHAGGYIGIVEFDDPVQELFVSDFVNTEDINKTLKGDELRKTISEVEQVAVSLLAKRAMTAIELRKKLRGKKYPSGIVESVIDDFKSRGLLNDSMYAESFTRSRWTSLTWGPRRIKYALLQKGVGETETERARKQVFEEDCDSENDEQSMQRHGMCKQSIDRLFLQASKQWLRCQDECPINRRAKIARWLGYRGFNWEITNYILRKLKSRYPS